MSIKSLPKQDARASGSSLTTGLALFSMFFGAGNLIFPLLIGKAVGSQVWYAIGGLGLTAVIVPFLGLAAMLLYQADCSRFFGRLGRVPGILLFALLQLILGPFGVIPRLVTLIHAMAKPYLFNIPLIPFSILAAGTLFLCSLRPSQLIKWLGAYLTPILLLSLGALVFFGLSTPSTAMPTAEGSLPSFMQGLLGGYNTMDLIAAFLFATVILPHFQREIALEHPEARRRSLLKKMGFSSLIAAALLFLTYVGLCIISAHHGQSVEAPPEQLLSAIAMKLLGPAGAAVAAVAVITACLTTAMTLASIFADSLQKDLFKGKISRKTALALTLLVTTLFANLGFGGIAAFLGPILEIIYPGLILLTLLNLFQVPHAKWPIFAAFACSAWIYLA